MKWTQRDSLMKSKNVYCKVFGNEQVFNVVLFI